MCNTSPKITAGCYNHETIRVSLCELNPMIDLSYCFRKVNGKCFFIDEYEMDSIEPDKYIRVCKWYKEDNNLTNYTYSDLLAALKPESSSNYDVNTAIAGWTSVITLSISLVSMFICLITFALFKELRNIPGWNIINLVLTLIVGQLSFLLGSFWAGNSVHCFIIAITTHYGFLASFFWMNVIAFDLHRNFK